MTKGRPSEECHLGRRREDLLERGLVLGGRNPAHRLGIVLDLLGPGGAGDDTVDARPGGQPGEGHLQLGETALAGEDVTVVVSTGGRPLSALPPLPANARAAAYLPYAVLLPRTSVLVTNGGYGGVQQAVGHGIPVVVAGQTEDKVEVSARVGWSGAGINLKTNRPTPEAVRLAVRSVLADPTFRARAQELAARFAHTDALAGLDGVLHSLSPRFRRSEEVR